MEIISLYKNFKMNVIFNLVIYQLLISFFYQTGNYYFFFMYKKNLMRGKYCSRTFFNPRVIILLLFCISSELKNDEEINIL